MKHALIILCLLAAANFANAQEQPTAKRLSSPHDAVIWAGVHIQTLPATTAPHIRYFWSPTGKIQDGQALTFTLNCAVSHSPVIMQAIPVPNTGNQLWYCDLRWLYPTDKDYIRGHALFESLDVLEPYFHVVKTLNKLVAKPKYVLQDVPRYRTRDERGNMRSYTKKWVLVDETKIVPQVQLAVLNANVVDPNGTGALVALTTCTQTNNPIMRLDWFVCKALTTENNGFYYKFTFTEDSKTVLVDGKKVRKSAQTLWLERLGANEKVTAKLGADNRTIIFRSGVAGRRPRMVELYYGVNARPVSGVPLVTMTHDIFSEDVDPKRHPLRNLVTFYNVETRQINDRAREGIGIKRNGYQSFALFDANGDLQDRVPDNVAHDNTVPAPFDQFLQPGISCIRCHAADDGWKPLRNDLQFMLANRQGKPRLDIFDDVSSEDDVISTIDRLAGQFAATDQQLDNALRIARNGYADAVFRSTKYSALRAQGLTVPVVSRVLENMYAKYVFQSIGQQEACRELGYEVSEEWAATLFDQILPPIASNQHGFSPEDPIIGGIRSGTKERRMGVSRFEWEQVFQDAKLRVLTQQAIQAGRTKQ